MNPFRRLAAAPSFIPSLVVSLTFVTGATFGAGLLLATTLGDWLPRESASSTASDCGGNCPAMLPCGVPLLEPGGVCQPPDGL